MSFVRRSLFLFCSILLLAGLVPRGLPAQSPPATVLTGDASAKPQQAYTLPPDKLAKAIAISRIRNILDIAGSLWGVAVLWVLLATRFFSGLEAWVGRVFHRRWLQDSANG